MRKVILGRGLSKRGKGLVNNGGRDAETKCHLTPCGIDSVGQIDRPGVLDGHGGDR